MRPDNAHVVASGANEAELREELLESSGVAGKLMFGGVAKRSSTGHFSALILISSATKGTVEPSWRRVADTFSAPAHTTTKSRISSLLAASALPSPPCTHETVG